VFPVSAKMSLIWVVTMVNLSGSSVTLPALSFFNIQGPLEAVFLLRHILSLSGFCSLPFAVNFIGSFWFSSILTYLAIYMF
jgi:hypothetical protein